MYYTIEWFHYIIYVFKNVHLAINKWLNLLIHWFWIFLGNLTRLLTRLISVLFFFYQINFFLSKTHLLFRLDVNSFWIKQSRMFLLRLRCFRFAIYFSIDTAPKGKCYRKTLQRNERTRLLMRYHCLITYC